jgi:ABC-type branched-subunit amino acid transport system substrate-binding protein
MRIVVGLLVVALLSAGCGARLDDAQKLAAKGGRSTTGVQLAAAGPSASTSSTGSTQSVAGPSGGASTAGPVASGGGGGGVSTPGGSGGSGSAPCVGSGGATDVGVTETTITTGSVATVGGPVPGLFKNVQGGVKAYYNYINSTQGGVCGRKLQAEFADDRLDAAVNRSATQSLVDHVLGFVGGYSVLDDAGAQVLSGTGIPDIGSAIGAVRASMPENFALTPVPPDRQSNGSQPTWRYFMSHYGVSRAVVIWPAQADARNSAQAFQKDMISVGLNVVDTLEVAVTETNYTGVAQKIANDKADILVTALEVNGISRLASALQQVGYKPTVAFYGQQAYGQQLIKLAGTAADGAILALGHDIVENSANNPEVAKFAEWFARTNPGDDLDFFAIQGWVAASMFVRALKQAGPAPTRANVLAALQTFHSFDADGLIAATDPAGKKSNGCFHVVTIEGGQWKVIDPASGFICDT